MSKLTSKLPYLKLSAVLVLITISLNAPPLIALAASCSGGEGAHCGG